MGGDGSTPTRSYYSSSASSSSTRYSCSSTRYSYNLNNNQQNQHQPNYYFYPGHHYRRDGANSDDTDDSISEGSSSNFSELVFVIILVFIHSRPEKLKSPDQINSWKLINQFQKKTFWQNSIFCNFKNGQKSIFELGKSLKLPKMLFHGKKIRFIWFHEFFCLDFFKFSGPLRNV